MEKKSSAQVLAPEPASETLIEDGNLEYVNASGHVQELDRQFSFFSVFALGGTAGNAWGALAGSILTSIYNGGPPGAIYEYIVVSVPYFAIAASLAELASSVPSSAGVYHWASITAGPKYGILLGFLAGWWNYFGWLIGGASAMAAMGYYVLAMYTLYHPDFVYQPWHVFLIYVICAWGTCAFIILGNRLLPAMNKLGLFFIVSGCLITIIVCAAMPGTDGRPPHGTNSFVWLDWSADVGYTSQGFVFLMGMLNGAYSIGTPDCMTHLAEEVPRPEINLPKAIAAQMIIDFVTGVCFLIAIMYAINDLPAIFETGGTLPLAQIYLQATSSPAGACGLLAVLAICTPFSFVGCSLTCSRTLWTMARDGATPFPGTLSRVSRRWRNPVYAQLATAVIETLLACIYLGSSTAFGAFIAAFTVLIAASYGAAIIPHLLTRRRYVRPGPFYMKGYWGELCLAFGSAYIVVWIVIFCFPFTLPVTAQNMNYTSVIFGGITILMGLWWLVDARKRYKGPIALLEQAREIKEEHVVGSGHRVEGLGVKN